MRFRSSIDPGSRHRSSHGLSRSRWWRVAYQRVQPLSGLRRDADEVAAQRRAEAGEVQPGARADELVDDVDRGDDRDVNRPRPRQQLEEEVEAALEAGGVEHADDGLGAGIGERLVQSLDGHPLVEGQRLERVDAGVVVDDQAAGMTGADFGGHARIVGDLLGDAGEPGEEEALSGVGVADEEDVGPLSGGRHRCWRHPGAPGPRRPSPARRRRRTLRRRAGRRTAHAARSAPRYRSRPSSRSRRPTSGRMSDQKPSMRARAPGGLREVLHAHLY